MKGKTERAVFAALYIARTAQRAVLVNYTSEGANLMAIKLLELWADKKIELPDLDPATLEEWAKLESDKILGKFMRGMAETGIDGLM